MVDKPNYKKDLTLEQYELCWNKGTEPPFSGKYHDCRDKGIYKYMSAVAITYLPPTPNSILAPAVPAFGLQYCRFNEASAKEEIDKSYGMIRTRSCVLGVVPFRHLFDDGPEPSCLRYCINSLSLSLEKESESKKNTIE